MYIWKVWNVQWHYFHLKIAENSVDKAATTEQVYKMAGTSSLYVQKLLKTSFCEEWIAKSL